MEQEQNNKTLEQLNETPIRFPSGRIVGPRTKALLAEHIKEHPTITIEECLEELEAAGY